MPLILDADSCDDTAGVRRFFVGVGAMHKSRWNRWSMSEDMHKCGSYTIRQIESGRIYAGGTKMAFFKRRMAHRNALRSGSHRNDDLQADWNKYGEYSFSFEINEITSKEDVVASEQRLIDRTPIHLLYNRIMMAGELPGRKHADSTKKKMSDTHKKMVISAEHREKMAAGNRGKKRSDEVRRRLSEAAKGKKRGPFTDEHRANMSKARVLYEQKKRNLLENVQ
jgi:group I intron endonuclease